MNTKFRKLLSYVLAAAMIFSLMPQATKVVYADGISASVEQKEIKGDVGNQISNMEITITLTRDEFITLQNQEDVKSWFGTGFPQGMEAKVKGEPEDNSVTIAFSGTPTERKYAVMDITIPDSYLSSSTSPLKVTGNEKAAFYIGPEYVEIDAQSGLPTISATCGTGLDAENTFKVLLKEGIKFKAKADTEADLKQWFKNVPQGATIKLTEQIEDDATSATFKVEGNISEAGVKKIIPNFPKADALKDDSNLLDQLSHLTFLKEKEYVTLDVKPKLTVSGDGIIGKKGQALTSKQVIITVEGDTFKDSLNSSVDWIYNISDLLLTQTVSFDGARKVATIELTGTPAIGIPETGVRVRIPENVFTHYGAKDSSGSLEIDSDDVKVNIADTSSDATVKKADSAEADYQIEENTITGVPAGTVQDLKADILVNHAAASLKVVAAETSVTNAQEFDSAQDLDNGVSLASGQKVAVKAEDGTTVKVYTITLKVVAPPAPAAPTLVSADTNAEGTEVTVKFSKEMASPVGHHGLFALNDGSERSFSAAKADTDAKNIVLTVEGSPILKDAVLKLKYTGAVIKASDNGVLAQFSDQNVTNNSTVVVKSNDATVKKADSAEADYQIEENTITGVPAGTVQDLKADILVNHAAASLKVVAAETFVTNAQEFDSAQDLDNGVSLASGQKVAVKAEDGTTVKVYTITLLPAAPLPKSANVADVVVSGKAGAPVSAELSITLANESFNIGRVKSGAVVTDWFKNMPNGLNAVVKNVEGQYNTKVIITISGTPNAEFVAPISIVIPASGLLVSQEALNVEPNERASFDIKKADSSEDNSSGNSGSGSGGGSGSGSTSSSSDNSSASNKASTPSKTEVQTVKPSVKVAENTLQAEVSSSSVKEAIRKDKEIEKNGLEIKVDTKAKASDASVKLPKDAVNAIAGSKAKELRINTPLASVNFDLNAIKEINDKASKGVELSIKKVESASLHNEAKTLVGDRPVYDLKVLAENGESVSSFGEGKATVSIPYVPKAEEDTSRLTVYYISDEGVMEQMEDARYNAGKKAIVFTAEHFSVYAVGEKPEKAMFMDIEGHWAKDDIAYVSKKGLMKGVSEVYFAPNTAVTRGMFVTVIGRMAGAEVSEETPTFSDVDANKYYAPYVAWAAEQGIVKGMSETSFMPDAEITREQMAVIIDGYAKLAKMELSEKNAEMKFEDEAMIGDWSKESIKMMQKAGILSGKENNYFDPKGMATRAEVAKVIRLLMSK